MQVIIKVLKPKLQKFYEHTMDVSGIGKTLYKLQLQQKPLPSIIWVLIYALWPENYSQKREKKNQNKDP